MAAHFHRMTELRARIDACERESAAADERAKLFRRNAAQALKSKEEAVSKQLTSSVAVEERRMETLRAQIKHAGAAYEEAQARCKALEGFLTQYGTLQTSRETLRETGSLDPHDTSDADLRALMKEEHLAILAALESAEEPFRPRQAAQANDADDLAERIEAAAARKAR